MLNSIKFLVSNQNLVVSVRKEDLEKTESTLINDSEWWAFQNFCSDVFGKNQSNDIDIIEEIDFESSELADMAFVKFATFKFLVTSYQTFKISRQISSLNQVA